MEEHQKSNMYHVCPEIIARNLKEINENPETIEEDVEQLRQLVLKEEGLNPRLDRSFLLRFLRVRKFDHKSALDLIRSYYKKRSAHPEIFKIVTPSRLKNCYGHNFQTVLDGRDQGGRCIRVFMPGQWDPKKSSSDEIVACLLMDLEKCIEDEDNQICGFTVIFDFKGLSWYQMSHIPVFKLRNMFNIIENSFPARIKVAHIVNESFIARTLIAIAKQFVSKKLRERIQVHADDFSSLHEQIHPSKLPSELGGELPPMDSTQHIQNMQKFEEFFWSLQDYGYVAK